MIALTHKDALNQKFESIRNDLDALKQEGYKIIFQTGQEKTHGAGIGEGTSTSRNIILRETDTLSSMNFKIDRAFKEIEGLKIYNKLKKWYVELT